MMDFTQQVRLAIYQTAARDGHVPTFEEVADARGMDARRVAEAYRTLAESHVIVLEPGSLTIWSAPPFSAGHTPFRVRSAADGPHGSGASQWYAPCAWDAFGIPAVLKEDAIIETVCPESGERLVSSVRAGTAAGTGLIHLEVPAKHFWDDIFYT
jgi:hypothetical protein